MLEAIDRIRRRMPNDRESLERDELVQAWIVLNLQVIGEACRSVGEETRAAHPEVPWVAIVGMRNNLVHGYFQVDLNALWRVLRKDLDPLRVSIEAIVEGLREDEE